MDFFDVLRAGCTFGGAKRSRKIHFASGGTAAAAAAAKTTVQQPRQRQPVNGVAASLDFFGTGTSEPTVSSQPTKEGRKERPPKKDDPVVRPLNQEEVSALRRRNRIHVSQGTPDPLPSFDSFIGSGVPPWLVKNLRGMGFKNPTAIQMQSYPAILGGSHVLASAPTGSGKTVAFLGPLIALLAKPGKEFARVLVIDPTRELAKQTLDEFVKLTAGRKWSARVLDKLSKAAAQGLKRLDLAIATPMRLAQMLKDDVLTLDSMRHLVLDEADKLLDLGFAPQIDEILGYCPQQLSKAGGKGLQTLMFSATMPPAVIELANSILVSPMRISIGDSNAANTDVDQQLVAVTKEEFKLATFRQMVMEGKMKPPVLIFVQSKDRARQLFGELVYDGIFVDVIHADRTKQQRDNTVSAFRMGKIWMLICTDLMARGVDFKGVETVVNWDFPQSAATYIHRIGRTGRAGQKGRAITFYSIDDFEHLRSIVGVMRQSGCEVPEFMLRLKKKSKREKRSAEYRPPERKTISTISGYDRSKLNKKRQMIEGTKKRSDERAEASTSKEVSADVFAGKRRKTAK